ncbi:Ryanodine receptor [Taenia solium]|eukprot:TsM_001009000 transcript=TsM_001009000 gene=TsM_001009000
MTCSRMQSFCALPRHRAIIHFLMACRYGRLSHEQSLGVQLIEEISGASLEERTLSATNAAVPVPIVGIPHSSHCGDAGSGSADVASPNSSSGGGSKDNGNMSIVAKAIIETSMYSDSSDETIICDHNGQHLSLGWGGSDGGGGGGKGGPIISSSSASATTEQVDDSATPTEGAEHSVFATDYCATPDPLRQLLTALCRTAMDQAPDDLLYLAFAHIMAEDEDDEVECTSRMFLDKAAGDCLENKDFEFEVLSKASSFQGPCQGNQHALANSRLWDAISGFFYLFAHMQDKLSKDPEHLDTLHVFLNLQTEMMIMLLSMLEGNVVNGSIGRQMVDTLAESSANVEVSDNSRRQVVM